MTRIYKSAVFAHTDNCGECVVVDKVGMSPHFSVAQSKQSGTMDVIKEECLKCSGHFFNSVTGGERAESTERGKWTEA